MNRDCELGFTYATDIRPAASPPILDGQDVIGRSRQAQEITARLGVPVL
jgi:superfamily II DNA/RNA helicase